ncbi:MAG: Lrp/AsnC family transcriptional regulator, partial [Kiritimatiellia bacterium]|nr:Lrp/AsnC family transcriptional regulator [Kiritimatiellia bacterium]
MAVLESEGIIRGYQPILNENALARDRVTAIIEVKVVPEREGGFNHIALRISRFPEVATVLLVSGQADLLLFVEGRSLHDVAAFVSERLSTIPGVTATATSFKLKTYKHHGVLMESEDEYERLAISP